MVEAVAAKVSSDDGGLAMSVLCFFMCKPETMRKTPMNYTHFSAFTLAEAVLVVFQAGSSHFGVTRVVLQSLAVLFAIAMEAQRLVESDLSSSHSLAA